MDAVRKLDEHPQRMTWPEIKAAYPDRWVGLGQFDQDAVTLEIHCAVVRGSGPTRREASASARLADDPHEPFARLYTGRCTSTRPW